MFARRNLPAIACRKSQAARHTHARIARPHTHAPSRALTPFSAPRSPTTCLSLALSLSLSLALGDSSASRSLLLSAPAHASFALLFPPSTLPAPRPPPRPLSRRLLPPLYLAANSGGGGLLDHGCKRGAGRRVSGSRARSRLDRVENP
ncbi:MAG: hypothetical protein BJ554DRAFT_4177 [Olpidium bornovanus]|uniref:Uncharacterized protein n=1 Tax=Olpidium bornovanus TaxID=278681 RepID=A0A8H7ZN17_9FUNG|nr:MAG: hypothetical protein BJ554DRAFT_4177 [Olpidium bornovanus]